ncbi:flagellar hook assembly protein FlgD [Thalassolituus sp.]|jgi:flagellar basal-body rod modification protein FlgD|uniref:flagellar hook assembly protein FlgD n=1 Tax=Thalassolituus sp. TaxID=2030822 RepID=UPI002609BBDA|nr:flagellar hook assembly protein FlgD [uncultured Thalassolituus sp.]TNC92168.1 MAG: flagellar hook capping protein [Thalassolituus sp.]
MSINEVSSNSVLDQYRTNTSTPEKENELGRNAFLELMVAQLNNQNPLEPTDNQAFVAQLAQFSTVEGIDNLNDSADSMMSQFTSNAALQASSLVGQSVIVEGNDTGLLTSGGVVSGYVDVPASASNMMLNIKSANGQLLEQIPVGNHAQGAMSVRWDGYNLMVDGEIIELDRSQLNLEQYVYDDNGDIMLDDDGNPIERVYPPGQYEFELTGSIGGDTEQLDMQMSSRVDSVTMSATGTVTLNLTGGQRATMDQIKQILDA